MAKTSKALRTSSKAEAYRLAEALGASNPEVIQQAMLDLALEFSEDMDQVAAFFELLHASGGDLTQITNRTHTPVSMKQFIEDDYFIRRAFDDSLWPKVEDTLIEIAEGGYVEALLMGAIGIAKTTIATVVNAYHLYLLSCERFPQLRYGLMPTTDITFVMLNKNDTLARDVTYKRFRSLIESSPYFAEHFPHNRNLEKSMRFRNGIEVIYAAADSDRILGYNVMSGIADEMNFMARVTKSKRARGGTYDQAQRIYTALVRRRKSRFETMGRTPGCLCVVSSKGYPGDFTEIRKQQALAEQDRTVYIYDYAQWDVLPEVRADGTRRFSGRKFRLDCGDEQHSPRVIGDDEIPRPGAEIIEVPVEFKKDFLQDMDGALRDYAGRSTFSHKPYFYLREKIWDMSTIFESVGGTRMFGDLEVTTLENGLPVACTDYKIIHPECYRTAHIDLARTSDRCGIAVGHIWKTTDIRTTDRVDGSSSVETHPHIMYDLLLAIEAPAGGEIEFSSVRALLYYLRDELGIPLRWVTYDGFQSVDSQQILRRKGFKTEQISVEGKDAYEALRTAMWQGRLAAPEHSLAFNELARLEQDRKTLRVDHPEGGSKDVSDSMAGVYKKLMSQRTAYRAHTKAKVESAADGQIATPDRLSVTRRSVSRRR